MATGGWAGYEEDKRKEDDFRYMCGLCMEPYQGRSPKILPCFHTFCLPCLTTLEASAFVRKYSKPFKEKTDGDEKEKQFQSDSETADGFDTEHGQQQQVSEVTQGSDDLTVNQRDVERIVFPCPVCRKPVPVPEGGVAMFQTKLYVDGEENAGKEQPPVLCDMCDITNQQPATHVCQQCRLNMCGPCRRHHDMIGRDHHVTSVGLVHPMKDPVETKHFCLIHRDQVLCFHCRQCDTPLCLLCKLASHDGHETVDLAKAAIEVKQDMMSLVTTANQQIQIMESSLKHLDRTERQLKRHAGEITQKINARYNLLMDSAKKLHDQLLEEVSAKEDAETIQLNAEKTETTVGIETLSTLMSRAARTAGNHPDALLLRKELRAALLSDDTLARHQEKMNRPQPFCTWTYHVDDTSGSLVDDMQVYVGRVVEGGATDGKTILSLVEMSDKMDRLLKKVTSLSDDVDNLKKNDAHTQMLSTSLTNDVKKLEVKQAEVLRETTSLRDGLRTLQTVKPGEVSNFKEKNGETSMFSESKISLTMRNCDTQSDITPEDSDEGIKCYSLYPFTHTNNLHPMGKNSEAMPAFLQLETSNRLWERVGIIMIMFPIMEPNSPQYLTKRIRQWGLRLKPRPTRRC